MANEPRPFNQETDPRYNMDPGIAVIPNSPHAKYMESIEQFPGKWGPNPGNPYVKREFPKMLYRAEEVNGKIVCYAPPPDSANFTDAQELERAEEKTRKFNGQCTFIVNSEEEMSQKMESGWRESIAEACAYLDERLRERGRQEAHREFEDRNMSPQAKAEVKAVREARGGAHVVEKPESPRRRGRPKGSKNKSKG